jgi:hypothetical protein
MALLVYGDDSSDEKRERVCAVAVVVGTWRAWRLLEREWFERTNGIPFHAKDCESDHGGYRNIPHAENKALYKDLVTILANSHVCGIGVAVDLIAARQAFPNPRIADVSYYRSFTRVMQAMKNVAKHSGELADITFDKRLDTEHNVGLLYSSARENQPEWTPHLAEKIAFETPRRQPRIQVADLLAYEAMKALDSYVGPVKRPTRKSWAALRATGRFETEAYSDEWFNDLKKSYPELVKKVGFGEHDYAKWLAERNRQHNMTNVIHFFNWFDQHDASA